MRCVCGFSSAQETIDAHSERNLLEQACIHVPQSPAAHCIVQPGGGSEKEKFYVY
jgi:hypothetical protein